jgi:hypothetical protein
LNARFTDYFDLHYLAQKFSFEGASLATAIAATFERRGTALPAGLPVGLTAAFAKGPTKIRGWEAFCRKMVPKSEIPPLDGIVQ